MVDTLPPSTYDLRSFRPILDVRTVLLPLGTIFRCEDRPSAKLDFQCLSWRVHFWVRSWLSLLCTQLWH
jgi:hypothetical protein